MFDKISSLIAVGAGLLQVMISIGLALIAYQIWKRLDDIDKLKKRVERTERQTDLLKRIVTNITDYCDTNDQGFDDVTTMIRVTIDTSPVTDVRAEFEILHSSVSDVLQRLRRIKSVIALGADSEEAVQSALMFLSQQGDVHDYESAMSVLLSREFVEHGHFDITSLPTLRQRHLEYWRARLRDAGNFIVHATWAPPRP